MFTTSEIWVSETPNKASLKSLNLLSENADKIVVFYRCNIQSCNFHVL